MMNDFDYDCYLKKKIASGARHRKCGSKSRTCKASTDYMSRKVWKEKCGKVMVVNMDKPMFWGEFIKLSPELKSEYLSNIIAKFGTTAADIGRMMGVQGPTVARRCKEESLGIEFSRGKRMSKAQRDKFEEFCGKPILTEEPNGCKPALVPKEEPIEAPPVEEVATEKPVLKMNEIYMKFSGAFDREMLYNSISTAIVPGTEVEVEVRCRLA